MTGFNKLPFLLSGFMTVLVGIISYSTGAGSNNRIYLYMIITMVVFFLIGQYAEKTLAAIIAEVTRKKKAEQAEIISNEAAKGRNINLTADGHSGSMVGERYEATAADGLNVNGGQHLNQEGNKLSSTSVEEGQDDGFEPLTVSRVIASALKNNND